jgi:hypothetical protein
MLTSSKYQHLRTLHKTTEFTQQNSRNPKFQFRNKGVYYTEVKEKVYILPCMTAHYSFIRDNMGFLN